MKVILRKDVETLGNIGDIVDVKEGYARNYLIPRKIAYTALSGNLKALEDEKKSIARKSEKELIAAEKISNELEKVSVTIPVQVGEEDKISVSENGNDGSADDIKNLDYTDDSFDKFLSSEESDLIKED